MIDKIPLLTFNLGCNRQSDSRVSGWGLDAAAYGGQALNVCYEMRGFADRDLQSATQLLLGHAQAEFARTNLTLQGLGPCGPKSANNQVRITWFDAEDFPEPDTENIRERFKGTSQIGNGSVYGVKAFGLPQRIPSAVRAEPTLGLNSFAYKMTAQRFGPSMAISEFKSVFLHELGHAVGMLHEHAQAGSSCTISPETLKDHMQVWQKVGINAGNARVVGTSFDPSSIMNYCYIFERGATVAIGFSNKDIQTVNALYPKPTTTEMQP